MSERVTMPALGESVTEGTVTRWLKNVGDTVAVDEPLLEVSTDKVDTEIPSPVAGVLQEILAQEDDTVPVGADLAVIGDGADGSGGDDEPAQQDGGQRPEQDDAGQQPQDGGRRPSRRASPAAEAPSTEQGRRSDVRARAGQASERPGSSRRSGRVRAAARATRVRRLVRRGETVKMPALGESVTEGTVTRWLKAEGDTRRGGRAAARGLDRQGRHRDPVAGRRHPHQDPRPGGRDRPGRRRPRGHRRLRRRRSGCGSRAQEAPAEEAPAAGGSRRAGSGPGGPAAGGSGAGGSRPRRSRRAEATGQGPRPRRPPPAAPGAATAARGSRSPIVLRVRNGDSDDGVGLRHAARAQAGRRAQGRPRLAQGHRRRWTDPQAGRARRRRGRPRQRRPHPPLRRPPRRRPQPQRAGRSGGAAAAATVSPKRGTTREDVAAAQDHRQADGRVAAGLGPADHGGRGRRHQDRPAAGHGQGRVRAARGRQAQLPAVLRAGRRRGAQGPPDGQRQRRRRRDRLPRHREPRRSRSTPSGACSSR